MKFFKILLISGLLFPFSGQVFAEKLQVLDKGIDGNKRYYNVTCPNNKRSGVVVHYSDTEGTDSKPSQLTITKTCMNSYSDKEVCKPKWDVDQAALESCK